MSILRANTLNANLVVATVVDGTIRYNGNTATAKKMAELTAPPIPPGNVSYTSAGTFSWVAPAGVTAVSVVAIGGGGGGYDGSSSYSGGGGGGLGWKNNITVVPGQTYTVQVGNGGYKSASGTNSFFISLATVSGYGGSVGYPGNSPTGGPNQNTASYGSGGGWFGDGGGAGGASQTSSTSGGGAGGYTGNGGNRTALPVADSGGAAGGGVYSSTYGTGAGGGTGLNGKGSTATGWWHGSSGQYFSTSQSNGGGGAGGSGGTRGQSGENPATSSGEGGNSGIYGGVHGGGGGGAGDSWTGSGGIGGGGGVRIIWGEGRSYPSNAS